MRRSSRILSAKRPVTVITISSSEDDEPLPRQQQLSPSDDSDGDIVEIPVQNSSLPSLSVPTRTPPRPTRQPVRSSSTDPRPSRPRGSQPQQQVRSASQPATEPRVATSRRRLESSSSSEYSPTESASNSSSPSRSSSSSSLSADAIRPPKRVPVLPSSPDTSPSKGSQPQTAQISSQRPLNHDQAQSESSDIEERAKRRKLALDKIIGAVKHDQGVDFVVKWRGLASPEKIPLKHLRILFPREVVDFLCKRVKWQDSAASAAAAESSESQMSTTSVS